MKTFDFTVVLADKDNLSEDDAEKLFEAGCDDGTPGVSNEVALIHFSRNATSFQEAIVTAKTDVESRLRGGASRNRRQRDHRVGNIMKKIRIHGNLGLKQTGRKSFINGLLGYYLFRISSFVIPPSPLQFPPPHPPPEFWVAISAS